MDRAKATPESYLFESVLDPPGGVYNTNYESDAISACLNKNTDWWASELILSSTYSNVLNDMKLELESDRRRAKNKPIGIIELNYPSSPGVSSSPQLDQGKFVDAFFNYLQKNQTKYLFANWYGGSVG